MDHYRRRKARPNAPRVIEALIFVSEEPLSVKAIADVLKEDKTSHRRRSKLTRGVQRAPERFAVARSRRRLAVCDAS